MPIRSPRGPAAILLVVAGIAACGGASSDSAAQITPVPPTPAQRTTAATPAATPTTSGPLEDLIPDEIGGVPLREESIAGADLGELDPAQAANYAKVLEKVDGPLEAFAVVNAEGEGITIAAWRVEGTDGRQLGEAYIAYILGRGAATVEDVTIGDKEIKRVTPANTQAIHVYVSGEVMFVVQAADTALLEETFAALP
jgi:hypothetical protein